MNNKIFWGNLGVLVISLLVLTTSFFLRPDPRGFGTHEQLFLPPCPFYWLTHIPCPSCGLTTSFCYLAQGNLIKAFQTHPMGPILFGLNLGIAFYAAFSLAKKRAVWLLFEHPRVPILSIVFIISLLMTWILRMVTHKENLQLVRSIF
jgi:hypothetical protein